MLGLSLAQSRRPAEVGDRWTSDDLSESITTESGHVIRLPGSVTLTISSPVINQTFQRDGSDQADIPITVHVTGGGGRDVEARWGDGAWTALGTTDGSGDLTASLANQPPGQRTLHVRTADSSSLASVPYIGVGDIYAIWGQSNGSGRGANNQSYTHATLRAVLFGNDYTWKELADRTDSNTNQVDTISSDNDAGGMGSVWPLVATILMDTLGFPVAFVPCCKGATGFGGAQPTWIPEVDPLDRDTLFGSALYRTQLTGARAVLWWQGEGGFDQVSGDTYVNNFANMSATAVAEIPGLKFIPCKLQECVGILSSRQDNAWNAIERIWAENADALEGPTLGDTPVGDPGNILTEDEGQPEPFYHLRTDATLQEAAERWAAKLLTHFPYTP